MCFRSSALWLRSIRTRTVSSVLVLLHCDSLRKGEGLECWRTSQDGRDEDGEQRAHVDGEVEDGEEAAARFLVALAAAELVGAERTHARLDAARAERYQQQADDRARAAHIVLIPVRCAGLMLHVLDFELNSRYRLPRKRCQRHDDVAGRVHQRQRHDCPA